MPGAFEGETVTRRRFMTAVTHGAGGVAAAAFALPALGFAIGPIFQRLQWNWQPVGPPSDFTTTQYTTKVITIVQGVGEAGDSIAYIRGRDPKIDTYPETQYNKWVALSSRCMHLGCPVRYVAAAQRFICPCHGGVYDFTGEVVGGPPVRPLDRFFTRLNPHTGLVELGPRYSVNDQLKIYQPRDPAQPLNGIGQYMYPPRFDTNSFPPGVTK
ncbi:MAG TPA: ubiquinol-cytochrome c reductase iron-sulfur subunit [Solirubrobacteraceae bacterium]|nr:ubiquinol-cytochrome c reductase iron-sulfur subunit [Solirubrobacteraceae bacterium]